jgi:hypothetical protein
VKETEKNALRQGTIMGTQSLEHFLENGLPEKRERVRNTKIQEHSSASSTLGITVDGQELEVSSDFMISKSYN